MKEEKTLYKHSNDASRGPAERLDQVELLRPSQATFSTLADELRMRRLGAQMAFAARASWSRVTAARFSVAVSRLKHMLPTLPYAYGALEPAISGEIMQLHHEKHHATYVNNLNAAEEQLKECSEWGPCDGVQSTML